jgi:hypothetical protein
VALVESLGPEKSKELYMPDGINFQEKGAIEIAKIIAGESRKYFTSILLEFMVILSL